MLAYADSSFIVRLITHEHGSEDAAALYRQLDRPILIFTDLHELEVRNGLRLKAFHEALALPKAKRDTISRELGVWEARLDRFIDRGAFARRFIDWGAAMQRACVLSYEHTVKTGTRAYDILHVAFALQLGAKRFITCDQRQAVLAKGTGQKVSISEAGV